MSALVFEEIEEEVAEAIRERGKNTPAYSTKVRGTKMERNIEGSRK